MSAAHDLLARPPAAAAPASIGAETVVELVPPRWRWRVISPGQWRVLSRLGRRARVRDLVLPGEGDVAEVVELVTELVAAGFLVPEQWAPEPEPGPPVPDPAAPATAEPEPADDGPVAELPLPGTPVDMPPVGAWPFVDPPFVDPSIAELLVDDPPVDRSPDSAPASGGPTVGPGLWPPIWRDPDRGPVPEAGPAPSPTPRQARPDPPGTAHSAPAGVRPYAPEPVPTGPPPLTGSPSWTAPEAHRVEPAPPAHPPVDDLLHLPRREPGRALPPASALLPQRHERLRLPGDEHPAPDAQVLRRLLGSLQQMEDRGSVDRDGAG
jgi:hypothetical protein